MQNIKLGEELLLVTLLDLLILIFQALYFLKSQQTFCELQSIQINFNETITGILLIGVHIPLVWRYA